MADYNEQTVEELNDIARDRGIVGYSNMNKDELVATLEADDRGEVPVENPETGELETPGVQPVSAADGDVGSDPFTYGAVDELPDDPDWVQGESEEVGSDPFNYGGTG